MFGGKTEHVIARLRQARSEGKRVRAFKHAIDGRYDPDHLVTHTGDRFEAHRVPDAGAILEDAGNADVIAVDEGQFFKLPLAAVVNSLLDRRVTVLVAGITHDSWGQPFEPIPRLAAIADEVILRQAPCRICGRPSPYTQRMTPVDAEFMVGGVGDYEPRCAEHFTPLPIPPEPR